MADDDVKSSISFAAAQNVVALSESITFGTDLLLANRRNANRNCSSDRLFTSSRCIALVLAHVKRHTYAFPICPLRSRIFNAPVKSTPVTVNGCDSRNRSCGKGGGSGLLNGVPDNFLQMIHFRNILFTVCLICGIQYLCRSNVIVLFVPECELRICASCMIKLVSLSFVGRSIGYFALSLIGALCMRPLQRIK